MLKTEGQVGSEYSDPILSVSPRMASMRPTGDPQVNKLAGEKSSCNIFTTGSPMPAPSFLNAKSLTAPSSNCKATISDN